MCGPGMGTSLFTNEVICVSSFAGPDVGGAPGGFPGGTPGGFQKIFWKPSHTACRRREHSYKQEIFRRALKPSVPSAGGSKGWLLADFLAAFSLRAPSHCLFVFFYTAGRLGSFT